jgi:predicted dinucleotide-binding enzyme
MATIAVMGGTGPQGRGLGYRFALAGHSVVLGSRDAARATEKADEINAKEVRAMPALAGAALGSTEVANALRAAESDPSDLSRVHGWR